MNAYWMGTITITVVFCVLILRAFVSADRELDRRHEIRWQERFYQPQLPARRGPVIDVASWAENSRGPRPPERRAGAFASLPSGEE